MDLISIPTYLQKLLTDKLNTNIRQMNVLLNICKKNIEKYEKEETLRN